MSKHQKNHTALVALFIGLFMLINAPLMTAANLPDRIFGLPRLYLYVFLVWGASIVAIGIMASRVGKGTKKRDQHDQ